MPGALRLVRAARGLGKKLKARHRRRFAYRLALEVGRVDVDQMLEEMTPRQLDEWIAYSFVEPFGETWRQSGTIAATVENGFLAVMSGFSRDEIREDQFAKPSDFLPKQRTKKRAHPRVDLASIERVQQMIEAKA